MSQIRCGFSQIDITPSDPGTVFMDGYGHRVTPSQGVHDPIYAKVCVMESDENVFALINLDIGGLGQGIPQHLRRWVRTLTDLEDVQFALCATHTHSGPVCGLLWELPINWLYWNRVGELIAKAILEARKNTQQGEFRFGQGPEIMQSINRRGKGIIDRRVPVCAFYNDKNELLGVIASASCHAVCNTDMNITGDYPSTFAKEASERYPNVPFLFLQGRGADINPHFEEKEKKSDIPQYQMLGKEVANSVFTALANPYDTVLSNGSIQGIFKTVTIPMRYPTAYDAGIALDNAKQQILNTSVDDERRYLNIEFNWYSMVLEKIEAGEIPELKVPLQAIFINKKLAFIFVPFELLTPTGNAVESLLKKAGVAPEGCFVVGYANGTYGYLAPSDEVGQDGYETLEAAHCYGLPNTSAESEKVLLQEIQNIIVEALCE